MVSSSVDGEPGTGRSKRGPWIIFGLALVAGLVVGAALAYYTYVIFVSFTSWGTEASPLLWLFGLGWVCAAVIAFGLPFLAAPIGSGESRLAAGLVVGTLATAVTMYGIHLTQN